MSSSTTATQIIDLPSLFPTSTPSGKPRTPYSILVLNQPVNEKAYDALSEHASYIICADAGADRLLQLTQQPQARRRLPTAIVGDLDSILPSTLQHYRSRGVTIAHDPDQYATDFTKGLKFVRELVSHTSQNAEMEMDIIAFGGLGGRVDQAFSIIHHLFAASRRPEWLRGRIYLIGLESFSMILMPGRNVIRVGALSPPPTPLPQAQQQQQQPPPSAPHSKAQSSSGEDSPRQLFDENVGIIPIAGKSVITLRGFEWDVDEWETEFGGQMSTSNHLRSEEVVVETSERALFTLEFAEGLNAGDGKGRKEGKGGGE